VLVIDEHGDRKWGKHTAHVGRQWLANIGKTDNGVVSVSGMLANKRVYWPIAFEPYTPAHHFEGGKEDPKFRTKLKIARELVEHAVEEGIPFRALVADSFYGEDEDLKWALREMNIGYVLALKPSHSWWHRDRGVYAGRAGRFHTTAVPVSATETSPPLHFRLPESVALRRLERRKTRRVAAHKLRATGVQAL
jgi:SRSO17 transposase